MPFFKRRRRQFPKSDCPSNAIECDLHDIKVNTAMMGLIVVIVINIKEHDVRTHLTLIVSNFL